MPRVKGIEHRHRGGGVVFHNRTSQRNHIIISNTKKKNEKRDGHNSQESLLVSCDGSTSGYDYGRSQSISNDDKRNHNLNTITHDCHHTRPIASNVTPELHEKTECRLLPGYNDDICQNNYVDRKDKNTTMMNIKSRKRRRQKINEFKQVIAEEFSTKNNVDDEHSHMNKNTSTQEKCIDEICSIPPPNETNSEDKGALTNCNVDSIISESISTKLDSVHEQIHGAGKEPFTKKHNYPYLSHTKDFNIQQKMILDMGDWWTNSVEQFNKDFGSSHNDSMYKSTGFTQNDTIRYQGVNGASNEHRIQKQIEENNSITNIESPSKIILCKELFFNNFDEDHSHLPLNHSGCFDDLSILASIIDFSIIKKLTRTIDDSNASWNRSLFADINAQIVPDSGIEYFRLFSSVLDESNQSYEESDEQFAMDRIQKSEAYKTLVWEAYVLQVIHKRIGNTLTRKKPSMTPFFPTPKSLQFHWNKIENVTDVVLNLNTSNSYDDNIARVMGKSNQSNRKSSMLGTVRDMLDHHITFSDGALPEDIIASIVLKMIEIISVLHSWGIAHNGLCLDSFFITYYEGNRNVPDQYTTRENTASWSLSLLGFGSKSTISKVNSLSLADDFFKNDMLSLIEIIQQLLFGAVIFPVSRNDKSLMSHQNLELLTSFLARNVYLRGRSAWEALLSSLIENKGGMNLNRFDFQVDALLPSFVPNDYHRNGIHELGHAASLLQKFCDVGKSLTFLQNGILRQKNMKCPSQNEHVVLSLDLLSDSDDDS